MLKIMKESGKNSFELLWKVMLGVGKMKVEKEYCHEKLFVLSSVQHICV